MSKQTTTDFEKKIDLILATMVMTENVGATISNIKFAVSELVEECLGKDRQHSFTCSGLMLNTVICDCGAEGFNMRAAEIRQRFKERGIEIK